MDGTERAAVLLYGLGEESAANVLRHLEPKEVQKVGQAMTTMSSVNADAMKTIVADFLTSVESQGGLSVDPETYIKKMITQAIGVERAEGFIDRILSTSDETGLQNLNWLDPQAIADLIRNEHPQIIATVLTYLDSEQAAEVLVFFPEEKRVDLVLRMASLDAVKPEALKELGDVFNEQLAGQKRGKAASIGGVKSVADVINNLDSNIESKIMDTIKEKDEELCESIKEQMFIFENIGDMDGRAVQTLLRDVSSDNLMLALKGADERVKNLIFTNMSKRAAELLKDDLEAAGPVKVSEVEAAQKEILAVARAKAEAGEISLGGKGGEEMI